MLNGNGREKEFSADEQGKLEAYTWFFVLYVIIFLPGLGYIISMLKKIFYLLKKVSCGPYI